MANSKRRVIHNNHKSSQPIDASTLGMCGEYDFDSPYSEYAKYARLLFLKEIAAQAQEVLTTLYDDCSSTYYLITEDDCSKDTCAVFMSQEEMLEHSSDQKISGIDLYLKRCGERNSKFPDTTGTSLSGGFSEWKFLQQKNEAALWCDFVRKWSKKFNLDAEWCREFAVMTLQLAKILNEPGEAIRIRKLHSSLWHMLATTIIDIWPMVKTLSIWKNSLIWAAVNPSLDPPEGLPVWTPCIETRDAYLARVEHQVRICLDSSILKLLTPKLRTDVVACIRNRANEYCERVSRLYPEPLWKKVKVKPNLERDISWTVEFQVLGKPYKTIAGHSEVETSTVKRAVEDTLELIDLRARPTGPGRPLKNKDSISAKITRNLGH
jgi:hypothetical protein